LAVAREEGAPSLKEVADEKVRVAMNGVRADPLVRRALEVFPGAEIVAVRVTEEAAATEGPRAGTKMSDLSTTAMPSRSVVKVTCDERRAGTSFSLRS